MKCPLCKIHDNNMLLETVNTKELVILYKKMTGEDFSHLFTTNTIDYCQCQNCYVKFFNPIVTGDETFYNTLQKFEWYYMEEKYEYNIASRYILSEKANGKILEIGAGKGAFKKFLPDMCVGGGYTGLEFSVEAKNMAAKKGITIINELIEEHAVKNIESYDVVVSFQVLEHVTNVYSFIKASIDTLKKGGLLIIAVPSEDSFLRFSVNSILNMPPHHVTRYEDKTFEKMAEIFNISIVAIEHEPLQSVHYDYYRNTIFQHKHLDYKMIDQSLKRKVVSRIGNYLEKYVDDKNLPEGHTVVAIFRK